MLNIISTKTLNQICGGDKSNDTPTVTVIGGGGPNGGGGQITTNIPINSETTVSITAGGNTQQGINAFMIGITHDFH